MQLAAIQVSSRENPVSPNEMKMKFGNAIPQLTPEEIAAQGGPPVVTQEIIDTRRKAEILVKVGVNKK